MSIQLTIKLNHNNNLTDKETALQLNQLNSKPNLTIKQLKYNCYYKFTNLPNYIFIYDKEYPNDLIPVINNDSDLKDDYHRFKDGYGYDHLNQQIEVISIEHLSFNQIITNLDNLKEPFIAAHNLDFELKQCLSFTSNRLSKDKKFFLYRNPSIDCIYMFHAITLTNIIYYQLLKNHASNDKLIKNTIFMENSKAIIKQIDINKIDYKISDKSDKTIT